MRSIEEIRELLAVGGYVMVFGPSYGRICEKTDLLTSIVEYYDHSGKFARAFRTKEFQALLIANALFKKWMGES